MNRLQIVNAYNVNASLLNRERSKSNLRTIGNQDQSFERAASRDNISHTRIGL
jgi:hypothetical protein